MVLTRSISLDFLWCRCPWYWDNHGIFPRYCLEIVEHILTYILMIVWIDDVCMDGETM